MPSPDPDPDTFAENSQSLEASRANDIHAKEFPADQPTDTVGAWLLSRLVDQTMRLRNLLLLIGTLMVIGGFLVTQRLTYDRSVKSLFESRSQRIVDYEANVRMFGGDAICLFVYADPELLTAEGMKRLDATRGLLSKLPGVLQANSLAEQMRPGDDTLGRSSLTSLLPSKLSASPFRTLRDWFADSTSEQSAIVRDVMACPLYVDQLIGRDQKTASIVLKVDRTAMADGRFAQTLSEMRTIARQMPGEAHVVGSPAMISDVYTNLDADAWTLTTISVATMLLVILVLFRSTRWALIPFVIVYATLIWTKALMVFAGIQLSMIGSMMTALVTVMGIATCIHIAVCYQEEFDQHQNAERATRRMLKRIFMAIFWTCATTAAGFGSMGLSTVIPIQQFAFVMGSSAMLVGLACWLFVPGGILLGTSNSAPNHAIGEAQLVNRLQDSAQYLEHNAWRSLLISTLLLVVASIGFLFLKVETDFTKNFRESSSILQGYRFVESRLGGAGVVEYVIDTPDALTPEFVEKVRELKQRLERVEGVSKVVTLVDFIDFFVVTLNKAIPIFAKPKDANAPARDSAKPRQLTHSEINLAVSTIGQIKPDVLKMFWSKSARKMLLQVRVNEQQSIAGKKERLEQLARQTEGLFEKPPTVTGLYVLLVYLIDNLLGDQLSSFLLSASLILTMTMLAFRSVRFGWIGFVPNLVPILIVVGSLGWLGWKMNVATAMIGSISMGLVVDFSIHYLTRFRYEQSEHQLDEKNALLATQRSTGKSMVFANLALMLGFSILAFSQFVPTVHFGMLVSLAILGGLLGNLIVLPALLVVTRSRSQTKQ